MLSDKRDFRKSCFAANLLFLFYSLSIFCFLSFSTTIRMLTVLTARAQPYSFKLQCEIEKHKSKILNNHLFKVIETNVKASFSFDITDNASYKLSQSLEAT